MNDVKELLRKAIVWLVTLEAKAVIKKYKPKIIIVTGSVGKTTAKDAVYAGLALTHFVRRSEKGYNSDIGVPLTILGVPNGWSNPFIWIRNIFEGLSLILLSAPYPEWIVIEVGADRPGDISKALSWLTPHVVVGTRFPEIPVHVEFYDSPGAVLKEEQTPFTWLSTTGVAVVNADHDASHTFRISQDVKKVSYGFTEGASVRAQRYHLSTKKGMPGGMSFDVTYNSEREHVVFEEYVGRGHVYALLAGIAVSVSLGSTLKEAVQAVTKYDPPQGRSRLLAGLRKTVLIDDSYNASPVAVEEGLMTLKDIPRTGRRIAVLGDMLELGAYSHDEHMRIGEIASHSCDVLVTVGVRAHDIAQAARDTGMLPEQIVECERGADASSALISIINEGDVILVKGSQSMRMERVVKSLMQRPELAPQLLVRQEVEWLSR